MSNYKFEVENPFGSKADIENDLEIFINRLDLDNMKFATGERELLRSYVIANQRAADWYSKARDRRRESRKCYAYGRIFLLLLIPTAVFVLSLVLDSEAGAAQAAALLTGLMAAFRASSEWKEKAFAASNFASAASKLKEKIYAFEAEWAGQAIEGVKLKADFIKALKDDVKEARKIAREQRDTYFTATVPPAIDIMASLETARTNVATLFKNYQSPKMKEALKKEESEKANELAKSTILGELSKLTAQVQAVDQLIKEKNKEAKKEQNEDRKKAINTFISSLRKNQNATELKLAEKTGALAAL